MSLIVNGTIIPTNIAGTLMINGISVTSVMVNGINAWLQSLVTGPTVGWSGNSIATIYSAYIGYQVSGFSIRSYTYSSYYGNTYTGAWVTYSAGAFSGISTAYHPYSVTGISLKSSGNLLAGGDQNSNYGPWSTYSTTTKIFTGNSMYNGYSSWWDYYTGPNTVSWGAGFIVSGGLISTNYYDSNIGIYSTITGPWISLT